MLNVLNISPIRSFDTEPWAAFYCRLSQDDGLDGESNSIQHQKQILERYAKEHGITRYKFYVDDGISGTTFNRPGFQEMLADIQHLYEDKIKGQLTDERFAKLSAGYEAEQKGLEGTIKELSEQIAQKTDKTINIDRFMKLVKKNTSFEELTPTLLNTFIEKILVHEIEVDAEGKRSQKIEIVYNFIGSVELPEEAYQEAVEEPIELPLRESRKRKKSA